MSQQYKRHRHLQLVANSTNHFMFLNVKALKLVSRSDVVNLINGVEIQDGGDVHIEADVNGCFILLNRWAAAAVTIEQQ